MLFRDPLTLEDVKFNRKVWADVLRGDTYQQDKGVPWRTKDGSLLPRRSLRTRRAQTLRQSLDLLAPPWSLRYSYFTEPTGPNNAASYDCTAPASGDGVCRPENRHGRVSAPG